METELSEVKGFIAKYYEAGMLKEEYKERTDSDLIEEFRFGRLKKYSSDLIALHSTTFNTVLDYMRKIEWE